MEDKVRDLTRAQKIQTERGRRPSAKPRAKRGAITMRFEVFGKAAAVRLAPLAHCCSQESNFLSEELKKATSRKR
ncbi:MAG: hypothetical protein A3C30_00970 [Candidatus Levybacteria bacterium RIFCSPHIGHO2_02_FULL_40_18]|nr:MAG: hypothetical protein A2869_02150 [Candidatus Levybacteria bacterium RIFCSPHIGHO2_01_FULL_40_58]OGH27269.1 MAG: hypothetical protein A3C30_00970 [Candidatus Levybacteria bacterium RIFCSPHIGHO2_02_FULL_40_18]OGH31950.1 MAG: hypothetical protein A3E43_01155 [Candidatus Levybacteria bacterium RIFCSPHIGHO2_12_FULL_40_31]OGH40704.1 MAG: hypothetical protein A2894_03060 [Candidatus Levybacteria bacterium RIFCSPLOWO2_01_FULL_40_64]OGH49343.1 MAG: hypothetical protein A3I54_01700 [Candidatus Lev